jgi:putative transposase
MPVHVVQRGNNRQDIFVKENDWSVYMEWLQEAAERYGCAIHAFVMMKNHVHLLLTPDSKDGVSRMMQYIGRRYVPYFNHAYGRSGTLWEGRYKASLIESDSYLLACMRYIEMNPVRAKIVKSPADYPWSSFMVNAYGRKNQLVTPHGGYLALGGNDKSRRKAYRELFRQSPASEEVDRIRAAWQTGTPLGGERFRKSVERTLRTTVGYAKRGRPKKTV